MRESSADARDPPPSFNRGSADLNRPAPNNRSIVGDRATHVSGFDKTAILFGDFRVLDFGELSEVENRVFGGLNLGIRIKRPRRHGRGRFGRLTAGGQSLWATPDFTPIAPDAPLDR